MFCMHKLCILVCACSLIALPLEAADSATDDVYTACYAKVYINGIRDASGRSSANSSVDNNIAKMGGAFGIGAVAVRTCNTVIEDKGFNNPIERERALLRFAKFLESQNVWMKKQCLNDRICRENYEK
ncbi:hypothetical protein [Agrobacterium sp. NPDC090283]|uniref:hypothetical protein n=1 Tax=Agrobacterium sp. NPDC090283 TaxID=3363920 RepID=UPI00383BF1EB